MNLDSHDLTIECPTCRKKIAKTVGWFKRQGQVCPHGCGTSFDTTDFRSKAIEAEKLINDTLRQISRIKLG